MKPFKRADRVGGQIQKMLSQILLKDLKDPRLEGITITGVRMSADLKFAKIYYALFGGSQNKDRASAGLTKARGFVKRSLAGKLDLRYMPELVFYYDESFDYGDRIDKLLTSIKSNDGTDNTTIEKQ